MGGGGYHGEPGARKELVFAMAVGLAMALLTCLLTGANGVIQGTEAPTKSPVSREPANPSPSTRSSEVSIAVSTSYHLQKPPDPPSPSPPLPVDSEMAEQRYFGNPFSDFPFGLHPSQHPQQQQQSRPPIFPGPSISSGPGPFQSGTAPHARPVSTSRLLGSGNFAVLRGGTFYGSEEDDVIGGHHQPFLSFGNGHGGGGGHHHHLHPHPPRFPPPRDFLANFRDFAELHAHAPQSFSHRTHVFVPSAVGAFDVDAAAASALPRKQQPAKPIKKALLAHQKSKKWKPPKEAA